MAPDGGGREVQPGAQAGRGDRAVLQDQPGDPGSRAPLGSGWLGRSGIPGNARVLGSGNVQGSGWAHAESAASGLPHGGARAHSSRPHTFHNISVS